MGDLTISSLTIPAAPFVPSVDPFPKNELRGFTNRFLFGRPERLEGRAKIEDDLRFIVNQVLEEKARLKISMSAPERGMIAKWVQSAINDSSRWWPGQAAPVTTSQVVVLASNEDPFTIGGVSTSLNSTGDGLTVRVGYVERNLGIIVDVDGAEALVVPFGSLRR